MYCLVIFKLFKNNWTFIDCSKLPSPSLGGDMWDRYLKDNWTKPPPNTELINIFNGKLMSYRQGRKELFFVQLTSQLKSTCVSKYMTASWQTPSWKNLTQLHQSHGHAFSIFCLQFLNLKSLLWIIKIKHLYQNYRTV